MNTILRRIIRWYHALVISNRAAQPTPLAAFCACGRCLDIWMLHGGAGSSPVRSIHLVETHAGILASELRRRLAQVSHTPSSQVLKLTHPYLYLLRSRKPALQMQYPQSRRHSRRCRPLMMHPRPLTALIKEQVSLPSVYESPMGENIDDSPGKEMILRSLTGCVSQRP